MGGQRCGQRGRGIIMAYLAAVSAGSGVPLFIRTRGDVPQLSFPVVASLNGAHFFTSNARCALKSCTTGNMRTSWKCFNDCMTLIVLMADDSSSCDNDLQYLLELVFNAMVLLVGLDMLMTGDVEIMKRELKCCYPLIDHLLDGGGSLMCPLTQCTDVAVHDTCSTISTCLETFSESMQTSYCCVTVAGSNLLLATDSWWELTSLELNLLHLFLSSLPPTQCYDVPVFLPNASPSLAHRLLVFSLTADISLVVLCDAEPSLPSAQRLVHQYWSVVSDSLIELAQTHQHSLAHRLSLDPAVLGFSLVHLHNKKCVTYTMGGSEEHGSTLLSAGYQGSLGEDKRRQYLKQFYRTVAGSLLPTTITAASSNHDDEQPAGHHVMERIPHSLKETYLCTTQFKGYAIHRDQYNLFVLYDVNTPTYALRRLSSDVLDTIVWMKILQ